MPASLNNLAQLYHAQGKDAEAEPLYQRSLAIREKALGPEHPDVATSLENYAAILRQTARADQTLYTGITNDLDHRINEHENGTGAKYTRGRAPFTLL